MYYLLYVQISCDEREHVCGVHWARLLASSEEVTSFVVLRQGTVSLLLLST